MNKILLVSFGKPRLQLSLIESEGSKDPKTTITDITDDTAIPADVAHIIGIISAVDVSTFVREVPPAQKKFLNKTLPYLIEDDLIQAVETQHIVSQLLPENKVRAVVISRVLIQQYLDQAKAQNVRLDKLMIDADLLSSQANPLENKVAIINGQQLIKTNQGMLASIPSTVPPDKILDNLTAKEDISTNSYQHLIAEALQSPPTKNLDPIDLLKGAFAPIGSLQNRSKMVQTLLTTCAVLLTVQCLYWGMVGATYQTNAESLAAVSTKTYRGYFPNDKNIIDIRRQAEGHISQATNVDINHSFLGLIKKLGEGIQQSSYKDSVLIKSIRYQQETGDIRIELTGPSIAIIENIRMILDKTLNAKTEQVNQHSEPNSGVTARIIISSADKKRD